MEKCDGEDYLQLFRLAVTEISLGTIPTSLDQVLIGDAEKVRPHMAKTVYIMGANDGVFPASVPDDGIFTESEKELLSSYSCKFYDTLEMRVSSELYCFYTALCRPTSDLFITYSDYDVTGKPNSKCSALKEVEALFKEFKEDKFEKTDKKDLIWRKKPALEKSARGTGRINEIIREILKQDEKYKDSFDYSEMDISSDDTTIEQKLALECFNDQFEISHSKLESFMDCHFKFMCEYVLELGDEPGKATFDDRNIGSLIHKILENVARYASKGMGDEDLKVRISDSAEDYMLNLTGKQKEEQPLEIRHTVEFIVRQSLKFAQAIREEFSNSGYQPKDFELKINNRSAIKPMALEKDGMKVSLKGIVDRVDTFESGDDLYVRVIDYKKSNKKFDPEKAKLGINDQMLLYLFSIWENGSDYYGGKRILPGGVCYVETNPKLTTSQKTEKASFEGMMLDDEKSIGATNMDFAPKKHKNTIEEMNNLKEAIVESIFNNVSEMKSGAAQARPKKEGKEDKDGENCQYCQYRSICRKRIQKSEESS
jgi:ATP-dependent helicase/nuclease subunit B